MITISDLHFKYGEKKAISGLSLEIKRGEIFGLLGPNGCGKTTLFRILSTSMNPTTGSVRMSGFDLMKDYAKIRETIGVVFQAPSLDGKLTVEENIRHHGHLYGLSGKELQKKINQMLTKLGLADRHKEIVDKLSGGLKRRVELAKGLLHEPQILILDEPSTGLDPGARSDLWKYLKQLQAEQNTTILVTTHLMEEAELCDRVAIMNEGRLIQVGTPENLKQEVKSSVLVIQPHDSLNIQVLAEKIGQTFSLKYSIQNKTIQIENDGASQLVAKIIESFPGEIDSVTFRKATLEDVFLHHTGHRFWQESKEVAHA